MRVGAGPRAIAVAAALIGSCAGPLASARADYTPPKLLSAAQKLQFTEAGAPMISADGDYVVFDGVIGSVSGVFRRDLATGDVEPVATSYVGLGARLGAPSEALSAPDAAAPSVSEEGRYVAFTTASDLGDQPSYQRCPQVYVRDMDKEASAPGAYVLASALDGSSDAILYEGDQQGPPGCPAPADKPKSFPVTGAQAAPGVAISGDGRYVVFTLDSPSDLHGAGEPPTSTPTPPGQVAVRDLWTQATTLVTTTPEGVAVPAGGAFPSTYSLQYSLGDEFAASSAAISADGNAVAWLGTDVGAQVPGASGGPEEVEPLWRGIAQGAPTSPPTRLLADAGLDLGWELPPQNPVLRGSLSGGFFPPVLSGDGHTVALQADVPTTANEASAFLLAGEVLPNDAYVVKVGESGQPRQVLALTAIPSYQAAPAAVGSIEHLSISPDGSRVALTTNRTQFAPAAVVPISPSIPFDGVREIYVANIADRTLARATSTFDSSVPNGAAGLSSFSGDGHMLVFASSATNLLWGDAIAGSEVYASEEAQTSERTPESSIGGEPAFPKPALEWKLDAVALPQRDGSVIVRALLPGAGRLLASAVSPVSGAKGQASSRTAKRAKRRLRRRAHAATSEPVAGAVSEVAGVPAQVQVRLRAAPSLRGRVDSRIGLYAIVRVRFSSPGHPVLESALPVVFRRQPQPRKKRR